MGDTTSKQHVVHTTPRPSYWTEYIEGVETFVLPETVPAAAFLIGGLCLLCRRWCKSGDFLRQMGWLIVYFGAQTGMNLYMKAVLCTTTIHLESSQGQPGGELRGVPAAFAVTALQQFSGLVMFLFLWKFLPEGPFSKAGQARPPLASYFTSIVSFSLAFVLNIALNNFSLTLIPLSTNLIVRSCLPLATQMAELVAEKTVARTTRLRCLSLAEKAAALLGFGFAVLAVLAQAREESQDEGTKASRQLLLGVTVCLLSVIAAAANLFLAKMLGNDAELNSLETTASMSLPAALFLLPVVLFWSHPIPPEWGAVLQRDRMTDWEVFLLAVRRDPSFLGLALFSGVLAFAYNVLQYGVVQQLSATHAAFAGNVNKVATIVLSLLFGLEAQRQWGVVMIVAGVGNIGAFAAYSLAKTQAKEEQRGYSELKLEHAFDLNSCEELPTFLAVDSPHSAESP